VDGVKIKENARTMDDNHGLNPTGVLLFGDNDGDDGQFDIAAVAIWDHVLTELEIQNLGTY
jgi:hypothetical protein